MSVVQSENFDAEFAAAQERIGGARPSPADDAARLEQWKREEYHGWLRWRTCRGGMDWSKPLWIVLLTAGFAGLCYYGYSSGRLFVTAGGVVAWFTLVNLSLLTYFGPLMPPPKTVPGPFEPGRRVRAQIGIYPPGYEWRKRPRVWVRMAAAEGQAFVLELTFAKLPEELQTLMKRQEFWRIQRADAPATSAVVETLPISREQINAGEHPVKIVAWSWDEQKLETFDRKKT